MNNNRNSNYELMRIISMFLIVLGHVIVFTGLLDTTNQSVNIIYNLLEFTLIVHVNSYVLVSGYFQSKTTFKQKKIWQIINASWFYRIIIMIVFSLLGIISISKVQVLKDILPVTIDNYWFIKVYLLLYCLSPFINKLINNLDKSSYQKLLAVGFIIFSIIPCITANEFFQNNGYTLYNFIYLYLVGAYLRDYPLEESYLFKKMSKRLYKIVILVIILSCVLLNNTLYYFSKQIQGTNELLNLISSNIQMTRLFYSNPIIIIQSIAYFVFFKTLNIQSKFINNVSKLMLGVYFIHENNYIRAKLYTNLATGPINSLSFIPCVFLAALIIFISCALIEAIRQVMFKFIYNRKISSKIRENYYQKLKEIYLLK